MTSAERSRIMRAVKAKDTAPELTVRRLLHGHGYRYRLHRKDLPGQPDIVFASRRKVIFVHGCFWHGHECKRGERHPKENADYWAKKISRNKERDADTQDALRSMGWDILIIWECEIKDKEQLLAKVISFLR